MFKTKLIKKKPNPHDQVGKIFSSINSKVKFKILKYDETHEAFSLSQDDFISFRMNVSIESSLKLIDDGHWREIKDHEI